MSPLIQLAVVPVVPIVQAAQPVAPPPEFDHVMAFGAAAVTLMIVCRTHERHVRRLFLGTAAFGVMAAIHGFLMGAWPLGVALLMYSVASLQTGFAKRHKPLPKWRDHANRTAPIDGWQQESRVTRLFGNR